eukprot:3011054-Alexandrium_andersonii.AAC.1
MPIGPSIYRSIRLSIDRDNRGTTPSQSLATKGSFLSPAHATSPRLHPNLRPTASSSRPFRNSALLN